MGDLPVYVITSDKYLWALAPFCYLFNIFWSSLQHVIIVGFSTPHFILPPNFEFYSISPSNYPADRWSDALITFLTRKAERHFCLLLEDYWLCRTVDVGGVRACHQYVYERPEILRVDLTADRLYAGGMRDVDYWGHYDIVETPYDTPYQMSTQAGIWNRDLLLRLLHPGKSAWEVELHTSVPPEMRVIGTRQMPVRYANGILKGKLDTKELQKIPQLHLQHIMQWIPKEIEING